MRVYRVIIGYVKVLQQVAEDIHGIFVENHSRHRCHTNVRLAVCDFSPIKKNKLSEKDKCFSLQKLIMCKCIIDRHNQYGR